MFALLGEKKPVENLKAEIADWLPSASPLPFLLKVENHFKSCDELVPDATQLLLEEFEI